MDLNKIRKFKDLLTNTAFKIERLDSFMTYEEYLESAINILVNALPDSESYPVYEKLLKVSEDITGENHEPKTEDETPAAEHPGEPGGPAGEGGEGVESD